MRFSYFRLPSAGLSGMCQTAHLGQFVLNMDAFQPNDCMDNSLTRVQGTTQNTSALTYPGGSLQQRKLHWPIGQLVHKSLPHINKVLNAVKSQRPDVLFSAPTIRSMTPAPGDPTSSSGIHRYLLEHGKHPERCLDIYIRK